MGRTGGSLGYSQPWCSYFVGRNAKKANIPSSIIPYNVGSVDSLWAKMKKNAKSFGKSKISTGKYKPKAGDLVFLGSTSDLNHVSVICNVNGNGSFTTIDGNVSTSSTGTNPKNTIVAKLDFNASAEIPGSGINICYFVRPKYGASA